MGEVADFHLLFGGEGGPGWSLLQRLGHGRWWKGNTGARQRTRIGPRNGHGLIRPLPRGGSQMGIHGLGGRGRFGEAALVGFRGGMSDPDGWRLESEGLLVGAGGRLGNGILHRVALPVLGGRDGIFHGRGREEWRHGSAGETWGVGGGLHPEMGEVQIRTGPVPELHGLLEPPLGVESVEDDDVDEDDEHLDHHGNDGAEQRPILFRRISRQTTGRTEEQHRDTTHL